METEIVSRILNQLNELLAVGLSPHAISYQFEKTAVLLRKEKLLIKTTDCKDYYNDKDLALILSMKNEALANGQFEQALKFHFIELKLLAEKGQNEKTELKIEPFYFEFVENCFIFHFNKRKENQRLIANLIERYNLIQQKPCSDQMLYC